MLKGLLSSDTPVAPIAFTAAAALAAYALIRKNNRAQNSSDDENNNSKKKSDVIEDTEYFHSLRKTNVVHLDSYPTIPYPHLQHPDNSIADEFAQNLHKFGFVVITLPPEQRQIVLDMFSTLEDFMGRDYFDVKRKAHTGVGEKNLGYFQMPSLGFETFQHKHNNDRNYNWPIAPPHFKEHSIRYSEFLDEVSRHIYRLVAIHLQLDDLDLFTKMMDELPLQPGQYSSSTIRMFRYFNTAEETKHDLTHIDIAFGAIVPGAGFAGLQIYSKEKREWIEIEKTIQKGDLVFMPGSLLQVMTNHYFMGTIHRVVRYPNSERYSLPIAIMPRNDALVDIVSSPLVDKTEYKISKEYASKLPFEAKEFVASEYRKRSVARMVKFIDGDEEDGKGAQDSKSDYDH